MKVEIIKDKVCFKPFKVTLTIVSEIELNQLINVIDGKGMLFAELKHGLNKIKENIEDK